MFKPDLPAYPGRRTPRFLAWIDACYRRRGTFAAVFGLVLAGGVGVAAMEQPRIQMPAPCLCVGPAVSVVPPGSMPDPSITVPITQEVVIMRSDRIHYREGMTTSKGTELPWVDVYQPNCRESKRWYVLPNGYTSMVLQSEVDLAPAPPENWEEVTGGPLPTLCNHIAAPSVSHAHTPLILGVATFLAFLLAGLTATVRDRFAPRP
jgi:hypothetical protein